MFKSVSDSVRAAGRDGSGMKLRENECRLGLAYVQPVDEFGARPPTGRRGPEAAAGRGGAAAL